MKMDLPSGRSFDSSDLAVLREMNMCNFVRCSDKPFKLKSGIESYVYVFGREYLTD